MLRKEENWDALHFAVFFTIHNWISGWDCNVCVFGGGKGMNDLTEKLIYYAKKCDVENWADAMGKVARIKALKAENAKLRETLSACAKAAGASVFPDCTLEFMAFIPEEIRLAIVKTKGLDK
jgi:hypothetical protein